MSTGMIRRQTLVSLRGAVAALAFGGAFAARAGSITFSPPANCAADSDILAAGRARYAYDWANAAKTLNTVVFTGVTNRNGSVGGGNLTLTTFGAGNTTAFTSTTAPFNSLSANYKAILVGSVYNSATGTTGTVTLNNLTNGHQYAVQVWAGDPRAGWLTLAGPNTFGGGATLGNGTANISLTGTATANSGGYVVLGDSQALGAGPIAMAGAQVHAAVPGLTLTNAVTVPGGGFRFGGTNDLAFSGTTTLVGGNRTIANYSGGRTLTLGAIDKSGNGVTFEAIDGAATNGAIRVAGGIFGGGPLTVQNNYDNGTVTLLGACTYGGSTTLNAGTLALAGGDNRLPTGTSLTFGGTSTLDLGGTSQSIVTMSVPSTSMIATLTGAGGALSLDGTATALQLGPGGTLESTQHVQVNMAGLSAFRFNATNLTFRVGLRSGAGNNGGLGQVATVTLAQTNAINASLLAVGDVSANSDGGSSTLRLGAVNTINANTLNVGYSGRSDARLEFAAPGSAAIVRAADGAGPVASWNVGNVSQFASAGQTTFAAAVDLSGGTLDARVGTLLVGSADAAAATGRAGTENGSFAMGHGQLDVGTLVLGRIAGTGSIGAAYTANGTFTVDGTGGVVRAGVVNLAENTITATGSYAKNVRGTFNLSGGATLLAGAVQRGSQTGTATPTATLNWNDGTIRNYDAATDLLIGSGIAVNLAAGGTQALAIDAGRTGTVDSVMAGSGTLVKSGAGWLRLSADNIYAGGTVVEQGTLEIGAGGAAGAVDGAVSNMGAIVFNRSGTLYHAGTIAGTGTVAKAGAGSVTLGGNNTYTGPTTVAAGRLNLAGSNVTDIAVLAGAALGGEGSTTGRLSMADGTTLAIDPSTPSAFAANGVSLTGAVQVVLDDIWTTNVVTVIDYGAAGFTGLTSLAVTGPRSAAFSDDPANHRVLLTLAQPTRTWDGAPGDAWDRMTGANWQEDDKLFNDGDRVVFDDTAAGTTTVAIAGEVRPGAVTFNNTSAAYTLAGVGRIAGAGALRKEGLGVLTVAATNAYTGGTTLAAGRLRLANNGALGTGRLTLQGGALSSTGAVARALALPAALAGDFTLGDATDTGAIAISGPVTLTTNATVDVPTSQAVFHGFSGSIDDGAAAYSLTRTGAGGILVLSGANTYDGGTYIRAGRINAGNASAFGTGAVEVSPTGQAYLTLAGPFTNAFRIAGTGYSENVGELGAIRLQGATVSGPVTLTGDARISAYNNAGTLSGVIDEAGGPRKLELGGTATGAHSGNAITVGGSGTNTYSGGTEVVNATVVAAGSGAFGTGSVTIRAPNFAARIRLNDGVNVTNALSIAGAPFVGTVGRGVLEATGTASATWSGPIAISVGPSAGGHLHTDAGARLTLAGPITAPAGFTQRTGNVVYAGGGSYASLGVTGTAFVGATNGIATNATVNLSLSAAATLDLNGFDQTVEGVTKGGSAATVGNGSTVSDATLTVTGTSTFAGVIRDTVGSGTRKLALTVGGGQFTLTGVNAYTGMTTVRAGTLVLGAAGTLGAQNDVTLSGGTLDAGTLTHALGTLTLGGGASAIQLGAGATLSFAASASLPWSGSLEVTGDLTPTSLRVGTSSAGLTSAQVSLIRLNGQGASIDAAGYIVPAEGTVLIVR